MNPATPLVSRPISIEKGWIDYNGHLNMAYYNVVFDRGGDEGFEALGMGPAYAAARHLTIYTAETHVRYLRELHLADPVTVSFQILEHDEKRLRTWQEILHPEGWTAATCETLSLHVDMNGPKVAPFPPDIAEKIRAMAALHATLPVPEPAGKGIAVKRRG